ncbi:hypothetical protein [Streptomyces odontomachi]|uniref:hypothetical protein n=1 Tax=Streptomyces odontomachi TaxID=2944940 RepID=UPI00210B692D|nr:hypothetical protein [Streptomyces sp. ODS25]
MPSPQLPGTARGGQLEPYRSVECRIGTHMCGEGEPRQFAADLPLIYEICQCTCHTPATSDNTTHTSRGTV